MSTLFYSWQSDSDKSTNRSFIEKALKKAIRNVKSELGYEESAREELVLDKDTKGIPGTPPIVETILQKISNSTIFAPDLTFVGKSEDGRYLSNPNVLIEYGWALNALGHGKMLPLMNLAGGDPGKHNENMPFDMRHLRNPITYHLESGCTKEKLDSELKLLTQKLTPAIRDILQHNEEGSTAKTPANVVISFMPKSISQLLHKYYLKVSVKLIQKPDQDFFRFELYWPASVSIATDGFDKIKKTTIDGVNYLILPLVFNDRIWPGQTIEIIGSDTEAQILYTIDNDTDRRLEANPQKVLYTLYLQDHDPVKGEIQFSQLHKF